MDSENSKYYIVYPGGDKKIITIVEIPDAISYEINDYARASRKEFTNLEEANDYCKTLATIHSINYILIGEDGNEYLD